MIAVLAAGALAVSVAPARLAVVAPAARTIELRNAGPARIVVGVIRQPAGGWASIRPARLVLAGGATGVFTVGVPARPVTDAGDHQLLVLLSAEPAQHAGIAVRLRLGVRVRIRVRGPLVHRMSIDALRVAPWGAGRSLRISLANRGNVVEQVRGRLSVTLLRRGLVVSRLRLRRPVELLPHTARVVALPYAGGVRGVATAVVELRLTGSRALRRSFRLRL